MRLKDLIAVLEAADEEFQLLTGAYRCWELIASPYSFGDTASEDWLKWIAAAALCRLSSDPAVVAEAEQAMQALRDEHTEEEDEDEETEPPGGRGRG